MMKKLLSIALVAVAVSASAQQLKVNNKLHSALATQRGQNPTVAATSNLDFETWSAGNPTAWSNVNPISPGNASQVTSNPGTGASSLLLTTQTCTMCPAYGLPKTIGVVEQFVQYIGQPTSLSFQYKCAVLAGDTGSIFVGLQLAGAGTGQAYMLLTGTVSAWTTTTVPFNYTNAVPSDTVNIFVLSSDSGFITGLGVGRPAVGSQVYMDAIALNTSAGIQTIITYNDYVMFPNPAAAELNFVIKNAKAHKVDIYDISGRTVNSFLIENERTQIYTEKMNSGMYFYRVTDANGAILHTDKFSVVK